MVVAERLLSYRLSPVAPMVFCVGNVIKNKKGEVVQAQNQKMATGQNSRVTGNVVDVVRALRHFHLNHAIRQTSNVSTASRKVNHIKPV